MSTYKITNVTNLAGKRDFSFNSTLDIEYVDGMVKKTIQLKAGDSLYLTVSTLPLSVHRLRVKKLITVTEVNASELDNAMKTAQPKPQSTSKTENEDAGDAMSASKKIGKKKTGKK
jgi:hypothetical protein